VDTTTKKTFTCEMMEQVPVVVNKNQKKRREKEKEEWVNLL
jgi:hypothetical protein